MRLFAFIWICIWTYGELASGVSDSDCLLEYPGISCDPDDVKFYLFPNPENLSDSDELVYSDLTSILGTRFDGNKDLIVLSHGFIQNYLSEFPTAVKNAYLKGGYAAKSNVVAVDWGKLSASYAEPFIIPTAELLVNLPQYVIAAGNVRKVGQRISDFLVFLVNNGLASESRTHLVGQSLGAHISGYAGTKFQKNTSTILSRVTGTDPAGPLFFPTGALIGKEVASFVDIVHTNRGEFGTLENLGHVDFNVNGGGPFQPVCTVLSNDFFCAHDAAPLYYAQSIQNPDMFAKKICLLQLLQSGSVSPKAVFGEHCSPSTRGLYNIDIPSS